MLAPPPDDHIERERARVGAVTQQIYEDTKAAVDDEIARMDAVKAWADREMDAATERVSQRLADGGDPDVVQHRFELELQAVMTKAMDPRFDPRPRTVAAAPPAVAPPPAANAVPDTPTPPPAASPPSPIVASPTPPAEPEPPAACACRPTRGEPSSPSALLGLLLALRLRRR